MLTSPFDYNDKDLYPEYVIKSFLGLAIICLIADLPISALALAATKQHHATLALGLLPLLVLVLFGFAAAGAYQLSTANMNTIALTTQTWVNQQYNLSISKQQALTLIKHAETAHTYGTIHITEQTGTSSYTLYWNKNNGYTLNKSTNLPTTSTP